MQTSSWRALGCALIFAAAAAGGCSKSSSSGSAASSAAATTSAATPLQTPTQTAAITSLVTPGPLARGPVPLAFRLAEAGSTPLQVEVVWSGDAGVTWAPLSVRSPLAQPAATAPAPGLEYALQWDTAQDIPGLAAEVLIEVRAGGATLRSAPFAVDNEAYATTGGLSRHPYLQSTRQDATVIRWRTLAQRDGAVEYGESAALGQITLGAFAAEDHEVELTGLRPGTRYFYRIVQSGQAISPRYTFVTAPLASVDRFRFLVVGDSGMNNPAQYDVAQRMAREEADFFLHTGDVVYPAGGVGAAIAEYDARFFRPYQAFLSRIPAWPVVGNHDLYGLFGQPFRENFTLPSNGAGGNLEELYYSFEWGDAKFIALEGNTLFQSSATGIHMNWLSRELSRNTKKWVIVYLHPPLYSAGQHGSNPALQANLGPMLERYKVDLVLAGHEHNYERTAAIKAYNLDPTYPGLVHVTTGGGGAALRPITPNAQSVVTASVYHYLRFEVAGDELHGEAVDLQGAIVDRFTIHNQ